jgi:methionine-rich copper-binding protein CopC
MRTLLITVFSLAGFSLAHAHAFLDHADPRVGSTVHPAPTQVKVWMTEGLEPSFCKLQVFDHAGTEVDRKDVHVNGQTMTVSVGALPAGTYKVAWKAVATDTHRTAGTFSFSVQ